MKSVWDAKNCASVQQQVKYLGTAADGTLDKIPFEYRDDPKILLFLSSKGFQNSVKKEALISRVGAKLFECLSNCDVKGAIALYENFSNSYGIADFYERLLNQPCTKLGTCGQVVRLALQQNMFAALWQEVWCMQ